MSITTLADLRPGDIGFGPIEGLPGALVSAGQLILGEGFRVGPLDVRHVFIVVEESVSIGTFQPSARCVEAMPSGAREATIRERWTDRFAYVRLPEDYPGQAADAATIARAMVGTPYSFLSYAALAAWRFGLRTPRLERWIDRRSGGVNIDSQLHHRRGTIMMPTEMICSVLVDQAWSLAGKRVMEGVAHQCVTPGALAGRLLTYPGAQWIRPGVS